MKAPFVNFSVIFNACRKRNAWLGVVLEVEHSQFAPQTLVRFVEDAIREKMEREEQS